MEVLTLNLSENLYQKVLYELGYKDNTIFEERVVALYLEYADIGSDVTDYPSIESLSNYIFDEDDDTIHTAFVSMNYSEDLIDNFLARYTNNVACYIDLMIKDVLFKRHYNYTENDKIVWNNPSKRFEDMNVLLTEWR